MGGAVWQSFGDPVELGEEEALELGELLVRLAKEGGMMACLTSHRVWGRFESGERRGEGGEFGAVAKAVKVDAIELFTGYAGD